MSNFLYQVIKATDKSSKSCDLPEIEAKRNAILERHKGRQG